MERSNDYLKLLEYLAGMKGMDVLHALAEAKTGNSEYGDFLPASIIDDAETALGDFVTGLENYQANNLINTALK